MLMLEFMFFNKSLYVEVESIKLIGIALSKYWNVTKIRFTQLLL